MAGLVWLAREQGRAANAVRVASTKGGRRPRPRYREAPGPAQPGALQCACFVSDAKVVPSPGWVEGPSQSTAEVACLRARGVGACAPAGRDGRAGGAAGGSGSFRRRSIRATQIVNSQAEPKHDHHYLRPSLSLSPAISPGCEATRLPLSAASKHSLLSFERAVIGALVSGPTNNRPFNFDLSPTQTRQPWPPKFGADLLKSGPRPH